MTPFWRGIWILRVCITSLQVSLASSRQKGILRPMAAHDFSLGPLAKSLDPMVAPLVWLYLHAGSLEASGFLHLRESYPDSILVPGKTTQKNNTTLLSSPMISYLFLVKGSTPKKTPPRLDTAAIAAHKQRRMWILDAILRFTIGRALPVSLVWANYYNS